MTRTPDRSQGLDPDLVEYFIVTTPVPDQIGEVVAALAELVNGDSIQVLDMVLIAVDPETDRRRALEIDELFSVHGTEMLRGALLSEHDIQMVAASLETSDAALLVVVESRWARPLSVAAHRVGGRFAGGERIPGTKVEAAVNR